MRFAVVFAVLLGLLLSAGCGQSTEVKSGQVPAPLTEEQKQELNTFSQAIQDEEGGRLGSGNSGN